MGSWPLKQLVLIGYCSTDNCSVTNDNAVQQKLHDICSHQPRFLAPLCPQNALAVGAPPRTPLGGSLQRSPDPLASGEGTAASLRTSPPLSASTCPPLRNSFRRHWPPPQHVMYAEALRYVFCLFVRPPMRMCLENTVNAIV